MTFEIEKGVKVPEPRRGRSGSEFRKYPWAEMEIGDSFIVPVRAGRTLKQTLQRISAQANMAGYRYSRKFCCRSFVGTGKASFVRVWRIEA